MKLFKIGMFTVIAGGIVTAVTMVQPANADSKSNTDLTIELVKQVIVDGVHFADIRAAKNEQQFKQLVTFNRKAVENVNSFFRLTSREECFQTGYTWSFKGVSSMHFAGSSFPSCLKNIYAFSVSPTAPTITPYGVGTFQ